MDFDDTPNEAAFRAEVRSWLEANAERLEPGEAPSGFAGRDDPDLLAAAKAWQARKAAAGWACLGWPREYGGREATAMQRVIWRQEEGAFRVPPDYFAVGVAMAAPTLMAHGSDEQKRRWLPAIAPGDEIWCQLFSEPAAGSDLGALRTRAERAGDAWVVNGQKIWSSGAHFARWGLLIARTDPDATKHAGLTYFVVDMQSPGTLIRPIRQITGGADFSEVFLNDVRIPDANRVSGVGNGWGVAITTLMNERSALSQGMTRGGVTIHKLIALAREARDERGSLLDDAGVRERIADFFVWTKGVQYTNYRTQTALSRGRAPGPEGTIGKLLHGKLRQAMTALAMELQGAAGGLLEPDATASDAEWQQGCLRAPAMRIGGGTDEILRNQIGERVLRLPPEPRVDKGVPFREIPTGHGPGAP